MSFLSIILQALPEAERRTAEAIENGTGIDDNAAVEAIKAERQHANQVRGLPCFTPRVIIYCKSSLARNSSDAGSVLLRLS